MLEWKTKEMDIPQLYEQMETDGFSRKSHSGNLNFHACVNLLLAACAL